MNVVHTDRLDLLQALVAQAARAGADAAEAILVSGTSLGVQVRQGRSEELERSEHNDVGLRVFSGRRSAIVSATSIDPAGFGRVVVQALALARGLGEDRFAAPCATGPAPGSPFPPGSTSPTTPSRGSRH